MELIIVFLERNKGPTDLLDDTTLTAEPEYSINFGEHQKINLDVYSIMESKSFLFVNVATIYQFKAKETEINPYPLCLGNISKDFTVDNMGKKLVYTNVCDFSVDYDSIYVKDILDIHKYL